MQKHQCPIIHLSLEGDRCGAAGLRRGYVQATVTYVDSSSRHLSAQGVSGCLKEPVWGLSLEFPGSEWLSFEEAESSNELEYCLLGGRSLWVGHQIKGGPTLLLTASVQVCNWTEQRADTLTLKKGLAGTALTYTFRWMVCYCNPRGNKIACMICT